MSENKVDTHVWHVEDGANWRGLISEILENEGHHVTSTPDATTAKAMIPDGIQDIKVSILDGSLGDGSGEELAVLIRQSGIPIGIIGLSDDKTPWADVSLRKYDFENKQLVAAVNKLLGGQE